MLCQQGCNRTEIIRDPFPLGLVERIGESLNARKGHLLEWGIIVLLGAEVLLLVVDFLASSAP